MLRYGGKMADFTEESGTTKEQRYKLAVERNAVVTGQTKAPLITVNKRRFQRAESCMIDDSPYNAIC